MSDLGVYISLFAAAFLAAKIFPAQSELGLAGHVLSGGSALPFLIGVASAGNTFGTVVNWFIGRYVDRLHNKKWFAARREQLNKATQWYGKYGQVRKIKIEHRNPHVVPCREHDQTLKTPAFSCFFIGQGKLFNQAATCLAGSFALASPACPIRRAKPF